MACNTVRDGASVSPPRNDVAGFALGLARGMASPAIFEKFMVIFAQGRTGPQPLSVYFFASHAARSFKKSVKVIVVSLVLNCNALSVSPAPAASLTST